MPPPTPSRRDSLALAGLGVVAVGEGALRAAARPAAALWGSRLFGPARWVVSPAVDALVERGRDEQLRLRALAPGGVTELAVGVVVDHALVERIVAELLRSGVVEDVADQLVASRLPDHLLLESPALDRVVDDLLASDQLRRIVAHVAASPEVREALAAQSAGLAGDLADGVRARTATADDRAERVARRLLRRRPLRQDGPAPELG
jgi:hypothetical protein